MPRVLNISFDERPIEVVLDSPLIVLIDPLVLDGLSATLQSLSGASPAERAMQVRSMPGPMRIGVYAIDEFHSGVYRVSAADLEAVDDDDPNANVCDVDSGTIVVVDIERLPDVARILTWERYEFALQSPLGDDSRFLTIVDELGGPLHRRIRSINHRASGRRFRNAPNKDLSPVPRYKYRQSPIVYGCRFGGVTAVRGHTARLRDRRSRVWIRDTELDRPKRGQAYLVRIAIDRDREIEFTCRSCSVVLQDRRRIVKYTGGLRSDMPRCAKCRSKLLNPAKVLRFLRDAEERWGAQAQLPHVAAGLYGSGVTRPAGARG